MLVPQYDFPNMTADVKSQHTEGPSGPPETHPFADEVRCAYAVRLAQFYSQANGGTDEHPIYSDEDWQLEALGSEDVQAYWLWVADCIIADKSMWPWDRACASAVLISRAASIEVEYFAGRGWIAAGVGAALVEHRGSGSEEAAWKAVAHAVLSLPALKTLYPTDRLAELPITLLTHIVSTRLAKQLEALQERQDAVAPRSGAMRAFERTSSHVVNLARTAGVEVKRNRTGQWTVSRGPVIEGLPLLTPTETEKECWQTAAEVLCSYLCLQLGLSKSKWHAKAPSQQLEVAHIFYADYRKDAPDTALSRHLLHNARALCESLGIFIRENQVQGGANPRVAELAMEEPVASAQEALVACADRIRQRVMQLSGTSFTAWTALPLQEQIILAQRFLL